MTRPVVPDAVRLLLIALGVCCLMVPLLVLWEYRGWTMTEGNVVVLPIVEYERTNMQTRVAYTRANGEREWVLSSEGISASARHGDRFRVLYNPDRIKDSMIVSFDTLWSIPIYATALGIVLTSLGLIGRSRRTIVPAESHTNAA
jgi:hypothetical protein